METIRFLRVQGILRETGEYSPRPGFETSKIPPCYETNSHEQAPSGYAIVLLDESGKQSWEGLPRLTGGFCGMPGTWSVSGYIPLLHTPGFYEIRCYNRSIYRSPISAAAPQVTIREWEAEEKQCFVAWDTNDTSQTVSVACMVGNRTYPLLLNSRERSLRFGLDSIPGPAEGRLSIRVSDGCRSGITLSEPFTIAGKPPQVSINQPAPGSYLDATSPITLDGSARGAAGDPLPLAGYQWYIDGQLVHTGSRAFVMKSLPPGPHAIRLSYRENNEVAEAETNITVNELASWEKEWQQMFPENATYTHR